jgi:adenylate cyclase
MGADEAGTLARLKSFEREVIDPTVAGHSGRIVKRMGDGYLVEFQSVVAAVECALIWQASAADPIVFRMGINLGDVIVEDDDLYGDGVNVAARLEALADTGGICLSEDAWRQVRGKVEADFSDLGSKQLKNIAEPLRVFQLVNDRVPATQAPAGGHSRDGSTAFRLRRVLLSPFRHIGASEDAEALATGLTETLASALAHFEEFELIDPGAGIRAVETEGALEAGHRLDAHYVLEGSVQIAGKKVRIGVQLVDVESGRRVWSETLNRGFEDVFELQDDITAFVASTLGDAVGEEQAKASAHKPTPELTLDEFMIRGIQLLHRGARKTNEAARRIFETVVETDPDSMLPTLCLSWTHAVAVEQGWPLARPDALDHALQLARDLMRRHPRSAHVHRLSSRILFTAGDHDQGLAHARRAYDLNPWHADMMICLGTALMWTGSTDEAIGQFEKAVATNPYLADHFKRHLSLAYFLAGRPADGLEVLSGSEAEASGARVCRILNLVALDRRDDAAEEARHLMSAFANFSANASPVVRVFEGAEVRETIVSALREAGLPE